MVESTFVRQGGKGQPAGASRLSLEKAEETSVPLGTPLLAHPVHSFVPFRYAVQLSQPDMALMWSLNVAERQETSHQAQMPDAPGLETLTYYPVLS